MREFFARFFVLALLAFLAVLLFAAVISFFLLIVLAEVVLFLLAVVVLLLLLFSVLFVVLFTTCAFCAATGRACSDACVNGVYGKVNSRAQSVIEIFVIRATRQSPGENECMRKTIMPVYDFAKPADSNLLSTIKLITFYYSSCCFVTGRKKINQTNGCKAIY